MSQMKILHTVQKQFKLQDRGSNCCLLWAVHDIVQSLEQQVLPALGSVEAAIGNYNIAENLEYVRTIADNT